MPKFYSIGKSLELVLPDSIEALILIAVSTFTFAA
jgi:hypothetical protein